MNFLEYLEMIKVYHVFIETLKECSDKHTIHIYKDIRYIYLIAPFSKMTMDLGNENTTYCFDGTDYCFER